MATHLPQHESRNDCGTSPICEASSGFQPTKGDFRPGGRLIGSIAKFHSCARLKARRLLIPIDVNSLAEASCVSRATR